MKKKHARDAMRQVLEKNSGSKIASLHYFQRQKIKKRAPKIENPVPAPSGHPRGELLLDRTPSDFDLALLKQQMELLQEGIFSIHKKLSDIETASLVFQKETTKLKEDNLTLAQQLSQKNGSEDDGEHYKIHKLPTGVRVYRNKATGDCVCLPCFERDHTAIRIQPYRIRISTVGHCPRCHNEFPTNESERKPVKILPPEDTNLTVIEPLPADTEKTGRDAR